MKKEIIQIGDKRLNEVSETINEGLISSGSIQDLAKNLVDTIKAHEGSAAGLSGVQIGDLRRIFVVKDLSKSEFDENPNYIVMINPEITEVTEEIGTEWEGCMSINSGDQRLFGPVDRPYGVRVEYTNLNGDKKTIEAEGFFSHLLQHEIDHLEGRLFLSYISNPKNIWKEDQLDSFIKANNKFPPVVKS